MKRIVAVAVIFVMAALVLGACGSRPEGDRVYALSDVEENQYGYTADSFRLFEINLFEDGAYRVDFQAKGMPVVASERGTYTIADGVLLLERAEDSSHLIDSIVSYDQAGGQIKALCVDKSSGGTYGATFAKTDAGSDQDNNQDPGDDDDDEDQSAGFENFEGGVYVLTDVLENESEYVVDSFKTFIVTFDDGSYTVAFSPAGPAPTLSETGTYTIDENGAMTLVRSGGSNILASAVSYDGTLKQITIECKGMGSNPNYTAVFGLEADETAGFEDFEGGVYVLIDVLENESEYTVDSFKTFTVTFDDGSYTVAFSPAGPAPTLSETGTYTIDENGAMTLVRSGGSNILASAVSYDGTLKQITIECKGMGSNPNYSAVFTIQE